MIFSVVICAAHWLRRKYTVTLPFHCSSWAIVLIWFKASQSLMAPYLTTKFTGGLFNVEHIQCCAHNNESELCS